jgi:AcrR family transcriptional regulator
VPRWQPDGRERLVVAALQLFSEQGYDETTVAAIAERAGLTKSTFFRHFPDKRDVLSAGQETLSRLFVQGIAAAPPQTSPLTAVAAGLQRAASAMGPLNREIAPHLQAAIATSTELQERSALKQVGYTTAMASALRDRGTPELAASVAAELGALAFKHAYTAWTEADEDLDFAQLVVGAIDRLRATANNLD